jgi:hypothetical protein
MENRNPAEDLADRGLSFERSTAFLPEGSVAKTKRLQPTATLEVSS